MPLHCTILYCAHPVQIPTAEEASRTAYGLLTAASAKAAGVISAPSGRGVRKHVCLHPGCGKVFHFKASAAKHQEKEHRYRRRLGEKEKLRKLHNSSIVVTDRRLWKRK